MARGGPAERTSWPPFQARAPWWGGDLQTLRNKLVGSRRAPLPGRSDRLYLPVTDGSGDRLAAMLDTPAAPAGEPLVVLVHGLTGCEDSIYLRAAAAFHLNRGRRVLRLNLRGAGPSRATCGGHYHAGCAPDLRDALAALDPALLENGLFLVGFSLGGNIVLRFAAAFAGAFPVLGAASVSAPIEPAEAAKRIMLSRNAAYHGWLLRRMKNESLAPGARLDDRERAAILDARTIFQFDNDVVAPRNGFADAIDYYARTAAAAVIGEVPVPALLIHARNDPWIPPTPYERLLERRNGRATVVLTEAGGHVGFHGRGTRETWHDRCIDAFLATTTGGEQSRSPR